LTAHTGVAVYFCDPHSPRQRGGKENTNGLLRQYIAKGTDLSQLTQGDLDAIACQINTRPRNVLGFRSPPRSLWRDHRQYETGRIGYDPTTRCIWFLTPPSFVFSCYLLNSITSAIYPKEVRQLFTSYVLNIVLIA
jgi:hypothetical protein